MSIIKLKKYFFILFFLASFSGLEAGNPIVFEKTNAELNISPFLEIYEDKTGNQSFEEIMKRPFKTESHKVPNFGITESVLWIRLSIQNLSGDRHLLLDLSLPTLDKIEFFSPQADGSYSSVKEGEQFPFYHRFYKDPDYLFDLNVPDGEVRTFYLKIASKEGIQLPVTIASQNIMFEMIKNRDILSGIYYGIMMAMILYNLFIYFSVRDKSYIYYVVYIICVMFTQAVIQGYPYQYLWPESFFMAHYNMFIFPILVGITGMEFMKVFLKVKTFSVALSRFSLVLSGFYCLSMVLAVLHYYNWAFHLLEYTAMAVSVYMLSTSIIILRKGFQPAKYFLIAWIVFLMGICVYVLKDFEILPFNNFTRYTMQIGSAIETVLLSFALAARINIYKKEKEDSQAKALELSKENERIITEQKVLLETKVKERTSELEETNRNLEETREQLINVEKMASLGQLTAGISHEINNPINFVVSNIQPLKRDISDIIKVLEKYNEIKPSSDIESKLKEIAQYKNEIDLDYLLTEIDLLLKGIDEGASRTSEIVKGLKNFSRVHEVELQFCDIHQGLDSTLGILNSIITSSKIRVVKQYGNFPQLECFPGKLNQVFMNILNNAVHAVGLKKYKNGEGEIIIKTSLVNDEIEIRIKDNGIGIAKANQSKIFEPFYTTKPVGAGTGLGLSIVYGIINSHNGTIEINSQEDEGAEFVIRLPLRHERV